MKLNKIEIVLLALAGLSILILVLAQTIGLQSRVTQENITRIARPGVAFWGEDVDVELRINANTLPNCVPAGTVVEPVYVSLAIDSSGSMAGAPLVAARDAATDFVDVMDLRDGGDAVSVVDFDSVAYLLTSFTNERSDLVRYIQSIPDGGGTNIADGLNVAAQQFALRKDEIPANARKVIILLSDGNQEAAGDPFQAAADAKAAGIQVITIALGNADRSTLQQMASSPGDYYETADPAVLMDLYSKIASGFFGQAATNINIQENFNDQKFTLASTLYRAQQGGNQISWQLPYVSQRGRSIGYVLQPKSMGIFKASNAPGQMSLVDCTGAALAQTTPEGPYVMVLFPMFLLFIFPLLALLWLAFRLAQALRRPPRREAVMPGHYEGVPQNLNLKPKKPGIDSGATMTHGRPTKPPKPPTTPH